MMFKNTYFAPVLCWNNFGILTTVFFAGFQGNSRRLVYLKLKEYKKSYNLKKKNEINFQFFLFVEKNCLKI